MSGVDDDIGTGIGGRVGKADGGDVIAGCDGGGGGDNAADGRGGNEPLTPFIFGGKRTSISSSLLAPSDTDTAYSAAFGLQIMIQVNIVFIAPSTTPIQIC